MPGKSGIPRFKTVVERERALAQVEEMLVKEVPQTVIAEKLGVSQPLISKMRQKLLKRFAKRQEATRDEYVALQTQKLKWIQQKCAEAYERSDKDLETFTEEMRPVVEEAEDGKGKRGKKLRGDSGEVMKLLYRISKRQGRLPAGEYLRIMMEAIQLESKLQGHFIEVNLNLNQPMAPGWEPAEGSKERVVIDVEPAEAPKQLEDKEGRNGR